jgi:DNA-binding CsgD family transcriptional regulator
MCIASLDSGMRLLEANADFTRQFGWPPAELYGSRFCDLLHQDVRGQVGRRLTGLLADQLPRFTEPRIPFCQRGAGVFIGELTATAVGGAGDDDRYGTDALMVLVRPETGTEDQPAPAGRKLLLAGLDARILEGVAAGVSTMELASMLYLSRGGVDYHLSILMRRLKVRNRPALVSKAYSMGLLRAGWPPHVHPDHVKE